MYFRFTLFNGVTLFVIALTATMVLVRFRFAMDATWPLVYYALLFGYAEAFEGSLSCYWILAGLAFGLLLRFEFMGSAVTKIVLAGELIVFGYVIIRGLQLLFLWPW